LRGKWTRCGFKKREHRRTFEERGKEASKESEKKGALRKEERPPEGG